MIEVMTVAEPSAKALLYALMLYLCYQIAWVHMQFFARGLFATPSITHFKGPGEGVVSQLRMYGWAIRALTLSALDWPLRRVSKGAIISLYISLNVHLMHMQAIHIMHGRFFDTLRSVPWLQGHL